jgi:hypothetical protein
MTELQEQSTIENRTAHDEYYCDGKCQTDSSFCGYFSLCPFTRHFAEYRPVKE